jgi:hypothetical protein
MKKLIVILFSIHLAFANIAAAGNVQELRMSLDDTFRVEETKDWKVEVGRILTLRFADVKITPKRGYDFSMMLYFKCDTEDLSQFDTPEKIATSVTKSSEKYLSSTIEKKVSLRAIPIKATYGFYTILTDAEVTSKATRAPGEFKYLTRGMVRLSKDSVLGFSIMTNDIDSEEYKKLLDYVYSFVKYSQK